jgi:hypothetical protein
MDEKMIVTDPLPQQRAALQKFLLQCAAVAVP